MTGAICKLRHQRDSIAAELSGPRPFRNPWEMGFLGDIFYMKLKGPWILNDVGHFGGLWLIVFIEFV